MNERFTDRDLVVRQQLTETTKVFFHYSSENVSVSKQEYFLKMTKMLSSEKDVLHDLWYLHCQLFQCDGIYNVYKPLRTVPPFVTALTFCASWVWSDIFGFLKEFVN